MRIFSFLAILSLASLRAACQAVVDPTVAAQAAFAQGKYPQAIKLYQEAVVAHPRSAELQSDLGLAYQMEGQHPKAISSYLAALRLKDLPHTKELLAIERCRLREYSEVVPLLEQIAAHSSGDDPLLPVISPCFLQANDALDALRISTALEHSGMISPDQIMVYRSQASMAVGKLFIGRLQQAPGGAPYVHYLKAARDSGSANARAGFPSAIGHSSYLHADLTLEESLALFHTHSNDPALLYMLSVLAGERAMQSILDCEQKYPNSPWLAQFQAGMFAAQGQPQRAKSIYLKLLAAHPDLPDLRYEVAMLYRSQGEWGQAFANFRAELDADPTDDRAVTGISESLIQLGRYAEAADFLGPRFSNVPTPLWAALDLSLADQKLQKYPEAIGVLSRAEKSYPLEKSIHFRLMHLYTLTGQMDLAQKENTLFAGANRP